MKNNTKNAAAAMNANLVIIVLLLLEGVRYVDAVGKLIVLYYIYCNDLGINELSVIVL